MYIIVDFNGAQADNESNWWPENGVPNYAALNGASNDLLDISVSNPTNRDNLTTWYRNMSANNFTITGQVFKATIDELSWTQTGISAMTTAAFANIQSQYPNKDWSAFDQRENSPNWAFDNSTYKSNGSAAGGDGILDFVFIQFRSNNPGFNLADLHSRPTLTTTYGGGKTYTTGSSATLASFMTKPPLMEYFTHEFAHNLYNSPHYMGANNTLSGNYFFGNKGWGMMSYLASMHTSNAWEKWLLGWMDMSNKTITSNTQYVSKDFVTQNDALRIPIPNTSPTQYLWIENHQKINFQDKATFN
jgi:M6 family metalloprotease-like protein